MTARDLYAGKRADARKPWRSGFCNPSHPPDSHERCRGTNGKQGCVCDCHQTPASEETDTPTVTATTPQVAPRSPDTITEPTVIRDLPDEAYHSQRGSLSASGAKWLVPPSPCPAKFRWIQDHPQTKSVFDFGHVAHRLVLGKGADIEVLPFDSMRSKDAREADAKARAAGKVPITAAEHEKAQAVAAAVKADPIASVAFGAGEAELSLFWPDAETGVIRRARLDWLTAADEGRRRFIVDLKTTRNADPLAFGKSAADYGYAISAANYVDGAIACGLDPDPAFLLVAVEKEEPYCVTTFQVPDDVIDLGRRLMRIALYTYAECVSTDHWPGYSEGIELLELPAWYVNRIEDYIT